MGNTLISQQLSQKITEANSQKHMYFKTHGGQDAGDFRRRRSFDHFFTLALILHCTPTV